MLIETLLLQDKVKEEEELMTWLRTELQECTDDEDHIKLRVRCCRLLRTYRGDRKKLTIHIAELRGRKMLLRCLRLAACEHRVGRFPALSLESTVQGLIEEVES